MTKRRTTGDISYDLENCKEKLKSSKLFMLLSLISEIVLLILFYIFVLERGNVFDYILSIVILLFFMFQIFRQSFFMVKRIKEKKIFQREYDISVETPEQRLNRERTEKFNRILKTENK
jgi:hypothetical protein